MSFIRTKIVKGHKYKYLVESKRENGKVKQKHIKYIGDRNPLPQNKSFKKHKPYGLLTDSESIGVLNWPSSLQRKGKGCDFKQTEDGLFVEFKTHVFSLLQRKEFNKQYKYGKQPIFAEIGSNKILVFKLVDVIEIVDEDKLKWGLPDNTPSLESFDDKT